MVLVINRDLLERRTGAGRRAGGGVSERGAGDREITD